VNCPLEKFCYKEQNKTKQKTTISKNCKGKDWNSLSCKCVEKRRDLVCQARKVKKQEKLGKKEHRRQEQVDYDFIQ